MKTNLDKLHQVPEILSTWGSHGRRFGKTLYACHCVAGYLETLKNKTIIVLVPKLEYTKHWIPTLEKVLQEHGMEVEKFDKASFRLFIKNNNNVVKFISTHHPHPIDFGASYDLYPILDIDHISANFWKDVNGLTVREFGDIIIKYLNYYKNEI